MKHLRKSIFSINNKVIGYADKTQNEYVIQFLDLMLKLYHLTKSIKDISTWHSRVVYLGYKNLL